MEIKKCKYKIRCELGACPNRATHTLIPARTGIKASLHVCSDCLREIASLSREALGDNSDTVTSDVKGNTTQPSVKNGRVKRKEGKLE